MGELTSVSFERSKQVMSTDIGDGTALLDLTTNSYFSLNEVGAFVWELLAKPRSRRDILDAVVAEFDVAPETCESDIDQLIEELHDAALIRSESHGA